MSVYRLTRLADGSLRFDPVTEAEPVVPPVPIPPRPEPEPEPRPATLEEALALELGALIDLRDRLPAAPNGPAGDFAPSDPRGHDVMLHHTVTPLWSVRDAAVKVAQAHLARGFAGIGYAWMIDSEGALALVGDYRRARAHAWGLNDLYTGVALVGRFDHAARGVEPGQVAYNGPPTPAQLATVRVLVRLWREYINADARVVGHGDVALDGHKTACPGDDLGPLLAILNSETGGAPSPTAVPAPRRAVKADAPRPVDFADGGLPVLGVAAIPPVVNREERPVNLPSLPGKSWLQSKRVWASLVTLAIGVLGIISGTLDLEAAADPRVNSALEVLAVTVPPIVNALLAIYANRHQIQPPAWLPPVPDEPGGAATR